MVKKLLMSNKGELNGFSLELDESLTDIRCLCRHQILSATNSSYKTGKIQTYFVFENPNDECCGETVSSLYKRSSHRKPRELKEEIENYGKISELIDIVFAQLEKYSGVQKGEKIRIDLNDTSESLIKIPMFSYEPELGNLVIDLLTIVKSGSLSYSVISFKSLTEGGIISFDINYLTTDNEKMIEDFISDNKMDLNKFGSEYQNCLKETSSIFGYLEIK